MVQTSRQKPNSPKCNDLLIIQRDLLSAAPYENALAGIACSAEHVQHKICASDSGKGNVFMA